MKNIPIKEFETERLLIKKPTMNEQYNLWKILIYEEVNRYYFPTPNRIFKKYNTDDLIEARKYFLNELSNWDAQKPFYEQKSKDIENEVDSQKYTWSIFLKDGSVIGQMTCQPKDDYSSDVRDVGWFIDPTHQGKGYAYEAAKVILDYMFNEVEIDKIITSAAKINTSSWKLMEKLGFIRTGEKESNYFDSDGNKLMSYCYTCDKDSFNKEVK